MMFVKDISARPSFQLKNDGGNGAATITKVYCCDLLSIAMGNVPEGSAWVTVMGNMNTLAVAALTDCACVIFACGVQPDEAMLAKAKTENITIFTTDLPVFEAALEVYHCIE